MKKLFILILLCVSFSTQAQILHPVKWSYAAKRTSKTDATLFLKADIEPGWHIYSTKQADGGPVKTSFDFGNANLIGEVTEPKPVTKYEKAFEMNVNYFEGSIIFQQKVKLRGLQPDIKGTVKFMTCNDQKCVPPETISFMIPIK